MTDTASSLKTWNIINESCVELRYQDNDDFNIEVDYISEIKAIMTTANARMRLYDMLSWLDPSQVVYCDTDSVMFVYDETNSLHKYPTNDQENLPKSIRFGKGLGEWEDEMKEGEWIVEIVVGGAKSYSYRTNKGKVITKQKGLTLDVENSKLANFDTLKHLVLNHMPSLNHIETKERFQFRWENEQVITKFISKSIRSTISEKRQINGYSTLPYGFKNID
jgi:hypothetical protein